METRKNDIGPEKILNVIDTSAFITYPRLISHIEGQVFVPLSVIKQLDGLKNNSDINLSAKARHASFFIEEAIKENRVTLLTQFDRIDALDSESDNRIVGAAVRLKNSNPDAQVVLLATDRNMRIVAEGYGIVGRDIHLEKPADKEPVKARVPFYSYILIVAGVFGIYYGITAFPWGSSIEEQRLGNYLFAAGIVILFGGILSGLSPYVKRAADKRGYLWDDSYVGFMTDDPTHVDVAQKNISAGRSADPSTWIYID